VKNANEYDGTGISFLLIAVIWTTLIIALGGLHYHLAFQATLENARSAARHSFGKDQAFRKWATLHGGVYVPVTDETRPNPYLSHVLEREVKTESGRILTLINPAYMVRQAHKTADQLFGTKSHITSLKPTRKETAPDAWEADALASFENGELEQSSLVKLDGKPYLRLMRPMVVEEGCLKCHNAQGYKVGDIRGGHLSPYIAQAMAFSGCWDFCLTK